MSNKAGHQTLLKNSKCSKDGEMNSHYSKVVSCGDLASSFRCLVITICYRSFTNATWHCSHESTGYVWWLGRDRDIELKVRSCQTCQEHSKLPASANLHPWEWPGKAWYRLHIYNVGPFEGNTILVIVDAYSKYIDTHVMTSATTMATILRLWQTFSTHGLHCTIVSDNGSPFTILKLHQYCSMNGIKHNKFIVSTS